MPTLLCALEALPLQTRMNFTDRPRGPSEAPRVPLMKLWRVYNKGWERYPFVGKALTDLHICEAETEAEALCLAKSQGFVPREGLSIKEIPERVVRV